MGFLFVILMGAVSAAMIFFLGYADWVMIVLALLWLPFLVIAALQGHMGFGGKGNTDLQLVIAGMFVTAAIIVPNYTHRKHCELSKTLLHDLAAAESDYFAVHRTYSTGLEALKLTIDPNVQMSIISADAESFTATAAHRLCEDDKDGSPDVVIWDSARGGLRK
ncbi:MAG: hypothetical protein HW386_2333 [Gammaproteobacteria bacterium]|nr:hypothetical protein [Gammaproteobacteria bacterium]